VYLEVWKERTEDEKRGGEERRGVEKVSTFPLFRCFINEKE
jgi:hypothetical protein